MSESDPKFWKCERCGAVLGVVARNSKRQSTLNVLRGAWLVSQLREINLDTSAIYSVMELRQGSVLCLFCGNSRTWYMGDQELEDLLENRKKRTFGLEVEHA